MNVSSQNSVALSFIICIPNDPHKSPSLLMLLKKQSFVRHPRIGRKNCIFIISGEKIAQSEGTKCCSHTEAYMFFPVCYWLYEISSVYGCHEASLTLTLFSGLSERALVGLAGALTGDRTPPPPPRTADRVVSGGVTLDMVHLMSICEPITRSNRK